MGKRGLTLICVLLTLVLLPAFCYGEVEWEVRQTLQLEAKPLDVAMTVKGNYLYVLTDQGELLIYTSAGRLQDKIFLGKGVDRVHGTPREEILLIGNSKEKTLQVISLDFIQTINTTGAPSKGPADAPVMIAVFTDFQCPYCAKLAKIIDEAFKKNPEKVRVAFKNFPLRMHRYAHPAAAAALAAEKQGRFWEFHDRLFENYKELNPEKIKEIAQGLGLDWERLEKEMKEGAISAAIRRDMSEGRKVGVRGTPTVFINGRILRDKSLAGFQAAIDRELKKAGAATSARKKDS